MILTKITELLYQSLIFIRTQYRVTFISLFTDEEIRSLKLSNLGSRTGSMHRGYRVPLRVLRPNFQITGGFFWNPVSHGAGKYAQWVPSLPVH